MRVLKLAGAVFGAALMATAGGRPADATIYIPPGGATPLVAGDKVQVEFSFTGDPDTVFGDVDILSIAVGFSGWVGADVAMKAFDGATLIGSQAGLSPYGLNLYLTSPDSVFTFGPPVLLNDFSAIADGTIDGFVEISVLSEWTNFVGINITAGRATSGNGYAVARPDVTITSVTVVPAAAVPEPGSLALLGAGLAAIGATMRLRRAA